MSGSTDKHFTGLTSADAAARLHADGPNLLPAQGMRSQFAIIIEILREPMLAMLLVAGVAYLLLGSAGEAVVLVCFAGFSIVVAVVQESRTETVLKTLRELAAPRALVIRDGVPVRVAGRDVVCGDLVVLEQGDRVPADGAFIDCAGIEADESLLTGESAPVRKRTLASDDEAGSSPPGGDDTPWIYSSTMITRGRGIARVSATGANSQVGKIGQSLAILQMEAPALRKQTARIVRYAASAAAIVTLAVIVLFGLLRGGWLEATLAGIAIGMSLLPEEFPVVLTVFLAMGAWRISKAGVLTRRAAAIETLGSATVLCTDKTGTLTENRMAVSELWLPGSAPINLPQIDDPLPQELHALLQTGALASAAIPSDPMEVALHDAHSRRSNDAARDWTLEHTFALSSDFLAMSNAWARPDQSGLLVAAKGAPEAIAELCQLPAPERQALEAAVHGMAERGVRVLGVAEARADGALGERQQDHEFKLRGLIGLSDPLRADVPDAVAQCRTAGIRVIMITGDFPATARAIASQAGLIQGDLLTGAEIESLDDEQLAVRLKTVCICARTMPAQKLRIVESLKRAGEVVAMTGDGVNDAPALKAAHIGIAMGKRGTDVAREAASIVLIEDDFGAIVASVRLGRRIYDNLRKAMSFILSAHVPIAGLALMPLLTGWPILFGPIQIALIEMIIDPVCAIAFEAEPEESDIMQRQPRPSADPLFSLPLIIRGLAQGAAALLALALLFWGAEARGLPPGEIRALVFFALVAALLALVLVDRAFGRSIAAALVRGNPALRYIAAGIVAVSAVIVASPLVRDLLEFAPVRAAHLGIAVATGGLLLVILERLKLGNRADAR